MEHCSVPSCSGSNIKGLFNVPFSDPVRLQRWTNACPFLLNLSSKELKLARICSKHFIPQQIAGYGKLRQNAVPSLYLPPSEASGNSKPQLNKSSFEKKQLLGKEQHSSNEKVKKLIIGNNELRSKEDPSLHLIPLKGLIRDSDLQINKTSSDEKQLLGEEQHSSNKKVKIFKVKNNKVTLKEVPSLLENSELQINKSSSEEQHLTFKAQQSSKNKKLVIEPSINVAEFSLNPSSFIYVPLSPIKVKDNESVEVDTNLENLSPDGHQELVSQQESPQISSIKTQNSNMIQMSRLVNLSKQYLTIQPLTVLNDINKNMLPKTSQEQENSYLEQEDLETRYFKSEVKEESLDNINRCISRLKYICYTCLSEDRDLTKLADVNDGINNLLYLVSSSVEVYEELSNYVDEVYICWECKALMNRFHRFRNQVCYAQQQLKDINDKKHKNLSKLSTHYNYESIPAGDTADISDILKSEEILTSEKLSLLLKQNGKINNGYIVDNNAHFLTIQMSAYQLSEDLHIRKSDPDFVATTHKCMKCIKTFNDQEELDKHKSDYHKVPHHVMCYICETYVRSDWHKEHNYSHFVKYKCHRCYKDFYSSVEILEHLYEAHNVKDTFEDITRNKLQTIKELRIKPLVLFSPTGQTFCYICSRCNKCYVSKTEIDMRCEPCKNKLETIEPKRGKKSNYHGFDEKLSRAKLDKKYLKDTTNHIIYDHGYAKRPESNHNKAKTVNTRSSPIKLDLINTDASRINLKSVSDEANQMECKEKCPNILNSIFRQDDIECEEITDVEDVQNARHATFNLSEFLNFSASSCNYVITKQETNVTEQTTEGTKEETDITEIKTDITESETKVTEEGIEEDFLLDPHNPTYKMIIKYQAHYTVKKMTVPEMQDSLEQRKSVQKFAKAMYKCEFCIEIFDNHEKRQSHTMLIHVKPTSYIPYVLCDICKAYIKERWLKEHRNSHFLKIFCHYCDFVAYNVLVIWNHLKLEHRCKVYSRKEFEWVKRRNTITNPGTCPLNVDIKANEKSNQGYICLECNEIFPTLDLKTNHDRLYHRIYKAREPKIKCSKCSRRFRRIAKLKEHYELKHKLPPVFSTCTICNKEVTNMRIHKRLHTTPPMSCVECDRVYPNKIAYLHHLRYTTKHAGDKCHRYKCNFCDKRFIKKSIYQDHVNYKHRGIMRECGLCHKMLSSAAQLWVHMNNVHSKAYKQYLCPTCGIVCKNINVLRDHELYHSGDHVTCRKCGLQFRKYSSLRNHKNSAHKSNSGDKAVVVEVVEQ